MKQDEGAQLIKGGAEKHIFPYFEGGRGSKRTLYDGREESKGLTKADPFAFDVNLVLSGRSC